MTQSTVVSSPRPGSSRRASKAALVALGLALCAGLVHAVAPQGARGEEFPFDTKTSEAAPGVGPSPAPKAESTTDREFEKGFGESGAFTESEQTKLNEDRLKVGGTLWNEFQYAQFDQVPGVERSMFNPNSLWIYLDSRLKSDLRGLVKVKAIYDPTVSTNSVNPLSGLASQRLFTDLEELKLQFPVEKKVFFTVGKQKIKWGSGMFWNPTDFMNTRARNFLYTTDLRSGVALIKTHVPVGAANFYLVNSFDGADQPSKIRHAVRVEAAVGPGEIAATAAYRKGEKPVFGLDVSTALWDLDVYGEVSYSAGNDRTFFGPLGPKTDPGRSELSWVAGASYEIAYSDTDTVIFALEHFYDDLGYTDVADYRYVFLGGGYQPFHLSQRYGMFMIQLPNPGSLTNTTVSLFNLVNLTDFTAMSRIDAYTKVMNDLGIEVALGVHYGDGNGELRLGGQNLDASARLMIDF